MRILLVLAVAAGAVLSPVDAAAQEMSQATRGIYYKCDMSKEARTDEIVASVTGPVFDRYVSEGKLVTWGWLVHSVGGDWRRAAYWTASDIDALLDVTAEVVAELSGEHAEAMTELNAICPTHDDYIWLSTSGSNPAGVPTERPAAAISMYLECDPSRELRADDIMAEVYGPLLDRQVASGDVRAWSWLRHAVGGPLRRLWVMDGADHKAILAAQRAAISDWWAESPETLREFQTICPRHHDYLWNIATPAP